MPRIVRRPLALQDLDEIWDYIALDSPDAADRLIEKIEEKCCVLTNYPNMGTHCETIAPDLRFTAVEKYLLFYVPLEGGIELIRVLHGARDIENVL